MEAEVKMGKVLVAVGSIWLLCVVIALAFSCRQGFAISVLLPNGTSQWQGHFILLATMVTVALGWLIPLGAGLVIVRRR